MSYIALSDTVFCHVQDETDLDMSVYHDASSVFQPTPASTPSFEVPTNLDEQVRAKIRADLAPLHLDEAELAELIYTATMVDSTLVQVYYLGGVAIPKCLSKYYEMLLEKNC